MQNHILFVSASIWYQDWERDVQSWMPAKKVRIYEDLVHRGRSKKAQRMKQNGWGSYMDELRFCQDLLHMLIKHPILNWCKACSAEQPDKITKLIKELTSRSRSANDPPRSGPVAHELRGRCETQAEDHEPLAPKRRPKPRQQKRSLACASSSWSSAEQPAESCNP